MVIGIDLSSSKGVHGTEVFAVNLINAMIASGRLGRVVLYLDESSKNYLMAQLTATDLVQFVVNPFSNDFGRVIFQQLALPILTLKHNLSVLYSVSPFFAWAAPVAKMVTIHDAAYARFDEYRNLFSKFYINCNIWLARALRTQVVTVSEFSKQELRDCYQFAAESIHVIGEGVPDFNFVGDKESTSVLTAHHLNQQQYFVNIGSSHKRKNLPNVLKAFQLFVSKHPQYQLVLVGSSSVDLVVQSLIKELGIEHAVRLVGVVTEADKAVLIGRASALLFPSLYEGFGLPILEAHSLGCPVITSSLGVMPETAGRGALFCNPVDELSILGAMEKLVSDFELVLSIRSAGTENLARFSWNKSAANLLSIIEDIIQ